MVKAIIIVPARMGATRFPGKMLAPLAGVPVVSYTAKAAKCVTGAAAVYVATDDELIAAAAKREGVEAIMTSTACANGSERVAEAYEQLSARGEVADVVINLQGDAPLTPHWIVEDIIKAFDDPAVSVATPVVRCTAETLALFRADRARGMVGGDDGCAQSIGQGAVFFKGSAAVQWSDRSDGRLASRGPLRFPPRCFARIPNAPRRSA